jgi:hypothetical protein
MKFNEEKLEQMKAENKVKDELRRLISEMILNSDVPEHNKLVIKVLNKARDIEKQIEEGIVLKFVTPTKEANTETLKNVLEYLELVEVGIKQFIETTPYVPHTEEEKNDGN